MELRQLHYFLAVAEHLHFTKAAKQLNIVQPALSQQVRHLENELGVKLLERTNRQVRLTPAGQEFRKRAEIVLKQTAAAATAARKIHLGHGGTLRLGFVSTAAWVILPRLLAQFYQETPTVALEMRELSSSAQLAALQEEKIDLGVTSLVSNDGHLEFRLLANKPLVAALPSRHRAARHRVIDLSLLSEERFILPPRYNPHGIHDQILDACLDAGFMPKNALSIRGAEIAICLVAAGLGVAIVPQWLQNMTLRRVVYRPLKKPFGRVDYFAVRRKGEAFPPVDQMWSLLDTLGSF